MKRRHQENWTHRSSSQKMTSCESTVFNQCYTIELTLGSRWFLPSTLRFMFEAPEQLAQPYEGEKDIVVHSFLKCTTSPKFITLALLSLLLLSAGPLPCNSFWSQQWRKQGWSNSESRGVHDRLREAREFGLVCQSIIIFSILPSHL